jgi:hypothetical protein
MNRAHWAALAALTFLAGCRGPEAAIPAGPVSTPADADQAAQFQAARGDPATLDDKLFILWEYGGALRERALAEVVLAKATDPAIKDLAVLVRDGHQLGMDAMKPPAAQLGLRLPTAPTSLERAAIDAAAALPPRELEAFFLRRQRAMHAWDIKVFEDYAGVARNAALKRYVAATIAPLREHADTVDRLARKSGVGAPAPPAR